MLIYNQTQAERAGLTLADLGLRSWAPDEVKALQAKVGATPDGWLGPKTIAAWKAWEARSKGTSVAIVGGVAVPVPAGIRWVTWMDGDPEVKPLRSRPRRQSDGPAPKQIVVHESVTSTWQGAWNVLTRRHLGVHVMIHRDGTVSQHANLMDICAHAGGGKNNSVGVEVINPYYGAKALPDQQVIEVPWAHRGKYALPTEAQIATLAAVLPFICEVTGVPNEFIGLAGGTRHTDKETGMAMGRMKAADAALPGIAAHTYWAHADGAYPVLQAYLRTSGSATSRPGGDPDASHDPPR